MKLFAIEMIKVNSIQTNSQQPLQMERADLSGAQLQLHVAKDVCLDNGQLRKINLAGTTLVRCTFRNADLRQADLFGCELTEVDFSGADLRDADLRNTVRSNVVMTGANTSGTLMDIGKDQHRDMEERTKPAFLFRSPSAAIDLGTTQTRIYVRSQGVLVSEPTIVAIKESTGEMEAGKEAVELLTRGGWKGIAPVEDGVVSDPDLTAKMLRHFFAKAGYRGANVAVLPIPAHATKADIKRFMTLPKLLE